MPDEIYSLQRLLALRKLTRGIADLMRSHLKDYLATLSPILRPKALFGDYVQGPGKETGRVATEKMFQDLDALYQSIARAKPFTIQRDLVAPLDIASGIPDLVPVEYPYAAGPEAGGKTVLITSPLVWVLVPQGMPPSRLREVMAPRIPDIVDVQKILVHYAVLSMLFARQPGVVRLLEALRFPVGTLKMPEFGDLPFTTISAPVKTLRPPDDVIIDSTEMSGKDVFEEVADITCIAAPRDPLQEQIAALARDHGFQADR